MANWRTGEPVLPRTISPWRFSSLSGGASTFAFASHSFTFFHRPASPTRVILVGASPAPAPSVRFFLEPHRRPTAANRQNHLTETISHDEDPISTSIGNNQPPSAPSPWTPPSLANPSSFYSQVPTRCWVRMRLPKAQVAKLVEESSDSGEAAKKIMELCVANGTETSGGSATKQPKEVWLSYHH